MALIVCVGWGLTRPTGPRIFHQHFYNFDCETVRRYACELHASKDHAS